MTTLPTELSGIVTPYKGDGRRLGCPTANIATDTALADGIYFGFADLAEWENHPALIFIGTPTTLGGDDRRIEVHLLDIPDEDYYELPLSVSIERFHRPNQKFPNVEELQKAMHDDETAARQWFSSGSARV